MLLGLKREAGAGEHAAPDSGAGEDAPPDSGAAQTLTKATDMLRIISGEFGGRYIKAPPGQRTRPTAQMAREALFSIIAANVPDAVFVDLFSGSGAVGIEALSRGASKAVFADNDRRCCDVIRANLSNLSLNRSAAVVCADVMEPRAFCRKLGAGLHSVGASGADIVFADPPYALSDLRGLPAAIASLNLSKPECVIVIEHGCQSLMPEIAGGYVKYQAKRYGDTAMSLYRQLI
jgi:16S rRNA (guanine(966)-N(2))-methyltransferase RsmD